MRIQTSDFAISVLNTLPAELRKQCASNFVRNYMLNGKIKWKFLVDFPGDQTSDLPNLLSDGYSACWRILFTVTVTILISNSELYFVYFLSVWSTGDIDAVLVKSNVGSIQVDFLVSHLVDQWTGLYTKWEPLNCSGKNWIRDTENSWSMTELFEPLNALSSNKDINATKFWIFVSLFLFPGVFLGKVWLTNPSSKFRVFIVFINEEAV